MTMIDLEVEVNSGWGVRVDRGGMGPASKAKAHSGMSTALPKLALEKKKLNRHLLRALLGARCFKVLPQPCHSYHSSVRQAIFPPFLAKNAKVQRLKNLFMCY